MAVTHSVVLYDPTETSAEVKAAAGFLAATPGGPGRRTRSASASSTGGVTGTTSNCSR